MVEPQPHGSGASRRHGIVSRADLLVALQLDQPAWFALPGVAGSEGGGFVREAEDDDRLLDLAPINLPDGAVELETKANAPLQMPDCWAAVIETSHGDADDLPEALTDSPSAEPLPRASAQEAESAALDWMTSGTRLAWPRLQGALRAALCAQRPLWRRPVDWGRVARRLAQARSLQPRPRRTLRRKSRRRRQLGRGGRRSRRT